MVVLDAYPAPVLRDGSRSNQFPIIKTPTMRYGYIPLVRKRFPEYQFPFTVKIFLSSIIINSYLFINLERSRSPLFRTIYITYKSAYSGLPRNAWLLSLVVLINRSGSMVLFFLVLYLTLKLNFSVAMAGRMFSIYGLGALAGSFLGGWLSDIFGSRKVQTVSLVLTGFGYIFLSSIRSPMQIAITIFALAVVSESFRPANATAIAEACPPGLRSRGFALNRMAVNLGVTIGPAVGGILAFLDYAYLFWVDGITCLLAAGMMWLLFRKNDYIVRQATSETHSTSRSVWKDVIFLAIILMIFLSGNVFVQLFNTWPLYLRNAYNLPETNIGLLLALNATMIVLFEMPLVHKIEKFDHLKIIAGGALLICSGFALLPFGTSFLYAALTVVIWTIGEMLVFPLVAGFIANRADDKSRGKYMGVFNFSFSLALVTGPIVGTAIYEGMSPFVLWMGAAGVGFAVWLGFRVLGILAKKESKHILKEESPIVGRL